MSMSSSLEWHAGSVDRVREIVRKRTDQRTDDEVRFLADEMPSSFFVSQLPREVLEEACRLLEYTTFERNDSVIREGDPGGAFYLILSGKCALYKLKSDLQSGAARGKDSLVAKEVRSAADGSTRAALQRRRSDFSEGGAELRLPDHILRDPNAVPKRDGLN